jgi:hypothetical protein
VWKIFCVTFCSGEQSVDCNMVDILCFFVVEIRDNVNIMVGILFL